MPFVRNVLCLCFDFLRSLLQLYLVSVSLARHHCLGFLVFAHLLCLCDQLTWPSSAPISCSKKTWPFAAIWLLNPCGVFVFYCFYWALEKTLFLCSPGFRTVFELVFDITDFLLLSHLSGQSLFNQTVTPASCLRDSSAHSFTTHLPLLFHGTTIDIVVPDH